ncbi:MAG TPA: hypothetical protein VG841_04000, partial [Caulobacterales bacterium]|nr:hypothetical protein [Caulobacterales bacterium]
RWVSERAWRLISVPGRRADENQLLDLEPSGLSAPKLQTIASRHYLHRAQPHLPRCWLLVDRSLPCEEMRAL